MHGHFYKHKIFLYQVSLKIKYKVKEKLLSNVQGFKIGVLNFFSSIKINEWEVYVTKTIFYGVICKIVRLQTWRFIDFEFNHSIMTVVNHGDY